jgi:hypothetical protein
MGANHLEASLQPIHRFALDETLAFDTLNLPKR